MTGRPKMQLSEYLTKPPTALQLEFADYLREEVGYDPTRARTKAEAFSEGVRLAMVMRNVFTNHARQTSEEPVKATPKKSVAVAKETPPKAKSTPARKRAVAKPKDDAVAAAPEKKRPVTKRKPAAPKVEPAPVELDETPVDLDDGEAPF